MVILALLINLVMVTPEQRAFCSYHADRVAEAAEKRDQGVPVDAMLKFIDNLPIHIVDNFNKDILRSATQWIYYRSDVGVADAYNENYHECIAIHQQENQTEKNQTLKVF